MVDFIKRFLCQTPFGVLSNLTLITAPLIYFQGKRVRANPKLPEAAGARQGHVGQSSTPTLQLIVLGDSSAAGVGARNQDRSFVGCLASSLARKTSEAIEWQLFAKSGVTCAQLNDQLLPQVASMKADYVVIAIGVNNVLSWTSGRAWSEQLDRLDKNILERFGQAVILFNGLPPMQKFTALPVPLRHVLGWRSQYLDRILKKWCHEKPHRHYLPIVVDGRKEFLAEDGFHPSEESYSHWAEVAASFLLDQKKQSRSDRVFDQDRQSDRANIID